MNPTLILAMWLAAAPGPAALVTLKAIVGDWEAHVGKDGGPDKVVRVSYRMISNDSVLAETWTTSSGATTMTMFHLDGDQLVATHYCAQGNQPRLKWARTVKGVLVFEFWDATNLASAAKAHLVRLELGLGELGRLARRDVYVEDGKEDVTDIAFTRVKAPR